VTVFVEYRVPVLVEVDENASVIVSVRVDDESVEGPFGAVMTEWEISADEEGRAIAVAETESWPAWDLGV